MVQGEWNKLVKPEMSGGDIAGAIFSSPVTVPMGILEELRGLFRRLHHRRLGQPSGSPLQQSELQREQSVRRAGSEGA